MESHQVANIDHCPPLCARGCGFFGSVQNKNMCSKCYKDYQKQELLELLAKPALVAPTEKTPDTAAVAVSSSEASSINVVTKKKRCGSCNKKLNPVELLPLQCRCGGVFCGKHRLAESHSCTINYKKDGKELLVKQNPIIKADKLDSRV